MKFEASRVALDVSSLRSLLVLLSSSCTSPSLAFLSICVALSHSSSKRYPKTDWAFAMANLSRSKEVVLATNPAWFLAGAIETTFCRLLADGCEAAHRRDAANAASGREHFRHHQPGHFCG